MTIWATHTNSKDHVQYFGKLMELPITQGTV